MAVFPSARWRTLRQRVRGVASQGLAPQTLGIGAAVCLLVALLAQMAFPAGLPGTLARLREGVAVAGWAALWWAAKPFFEARPSRPLRTLGLPVLAACGLVLSAALSWSSGVSPSRVPGAAGVLLRHLLAWLTLGFAFLLLLELRRLVMYRRTRASQRTWRLMLLLMSGAALSAFGRTPGHELGALQILFIIAAVALMVVNAFRISWIVGLSIREKVAGAGLSLALLVVVSVALGGTGPLAPATDSNALETYSYALDVFALQVSIFGILYSLTALLSLVFHLPTTGDVQRKSNEAAALHALAHLVDQSFDPERLGRSIAAAPVEAGSADAAWLVLDGASERLIQGAATEGPQVVAAAGLPVTRAAQSVDLPALFSKVRRTQRPLLIGDARADARVQVDAQGMLASVLVVPLVARGVFVGALLATRNVSRGFETDDVSSIQAFASQAALALDHARLFEEQIEMERLERELDIARAVQERLLPHRLPKIDGLALAAGSTPAREVGGDYYDFVRLDDGRLAFVVADVSGKGTHAAFFMAEMQGLFRSLSPLRPDPASFLARANETLRGILEEGIFVTALYGVLDPEGGTLELARAGHCPVAFARAGASPRLLRPDGMALGMAPTALFEKTLATERVALRPGDTLALYTDGLVESRSAEGEEFGYARLLDALDRRCTNPREPRRHENAPAALHDGLLADLCAFTGSASFDDDLTLMVFCWRCGEAPPSAADAAGSASRTVS